MTADTGATCECCGLPVAPVEAVGVKTWVCGPCLRGGAHEHPQSGSVEGESHG
jgi:hypothetical protein